jgi:hypothetical protein
MGTSKVYLDCTPLAGSIQDSDGRNTIEYFTWRSHNWNAGSYYQHYNYMDNVTITLSSAVVPEDEPTIPLCCTLCNSYGDVGVGGDEHYRYWNQAPHGYDVRYLYARYNVPVKGNVTRIDLQIEDDMALGNDWLDNSFDSGDVLCKVNNHALGGATELVRIGQTDKYRLSWTNLILDIDNDPIYVIFKSFAKFSFQGSYGTWAIYGDDADLNGDGENLLVFLDERNDAVYDQFHTGTKYKNVKLNADGVEKVSKDLVMRICFEPDPISWEFQNYTNNLKVSPITLCGNESLRYDWWINRSSMSYDKFIYIDKLGSGVVSGYPYRIITQDGFKYYTPTSQGTYYVNLSINNINVTSRTVTVNCDRDDWIYTEPNPTINGQLFTIHYNYSRTGIGRIKILNTDGEWRLENATANGEINTRLHVEGSYIIELQKYDSGLRTWHTIADNRLHPHIVGSRLNNYLNVVPTSISLGYPIRISGYHAHTGANVWIKFGENYIRNVGMSHEFDFHYTPEKAGEYLVSLVYIPDDSDIEIYLVDPIRVVIGGKTEVIPEKTILDDWGIDTPEKKGFLGLGIIGVFAMLPLKLTLKYDWQYRKQVNIPIMVHGIMICIGIALDIYLGLIDIWFVLLLIVVIFALILYQIEYGKRGTE